MTETRTIVIFGPDLTLQEDTLLRRYLTESHQFSGQEWRALRQVMVKLEAGEVQFGEQRYRFPQFYRAFINGTYAYPFLAELPTLADVARAGLRLQAKVARQIWEWLAINGIQPGKVYNAEYLVIWTLDNRK